MARLTALKVKAVKPKDKAQRLSDGDGLHFVVRPNGSRAWVLRITENGKRRDRGLGKFPTVSLAEAREMAAAIREQADQPPAAPTFRQVAEEYIRVNAPTWKHPKTAGDTRARLEKFAYGTLGESSVDRITRADVLDVLKPIWTAKPAASRKLRQRIRAVFAYAMAHGWVEPTFPILGVFRLKGQPKRDSGSIVRSCKASQSPVYPIRDAFAVVEHPSCPSSSSSCPLPVG